MERLWEIYRKSTRKFRDEMLSTWRDSLLIRKICLTLTVCWALEIP